MLASLLRHSSYTNDNNVILNAIPLRIQPQTHLGSHVCARCQSLVLQEREGNRGHKRTAICFSQIAPPISSSPFAALFRQDNNYVFMIHHCPCLLVVAIQSNRLQKIKSILRFVYLAFSPSLVPDVFCYLRQGGFYSLYT